MQEPVSKANGRRLLFVNACHSGQAQAGSAYNERLLGDAMAERFTVFSAAGPECGLRLEPVTSSTSSRRSNPRPS